jgi:hypothetical protein
MAKRNTIGMVIQIETSKGTAYGLCTHRNATYGYLFYFYPIGTQFSELKNTTTQFCCFFEVWSAIRQKFVKKIDMIEIPPQLKEFPVFRSGLPDPITKKIKNWWFWDGEKSWMAGEINDNQRKIPIDGIWSATTIIDRLENGYTVEKDNRN